MLLGKKFLQNPYTVSVKAAASKLIMVMLFMEYEKEKEEFSKLLLAQIDILTSTKLQMYQTA